MIVGTGVDIVEVERIKTAVERWGDSFLSRIFTANEISYAKKGGSFFERLAARFATKEAVLKAFGDGKWVDWKNIEVFNAKSGKPEIKLHGDLEKIRKKRKVNEVIISMSHTKNYAVANAILTKGN